MAQLKVILVDDELWSMEQFEMECTNLDIEVAGKFDNAEEALAYAKNHPIRCALLDVRMPGMDGIDLGKELKKTNPDTIVIYVTGYEDYVKEAILGVKADGYLTKPYNRRDVIEALTKVKLLSYKSDKRIMVRTFDEFDIFIDGELIEFTNRKAKELFAICIDREGGDVTMQDAIDLLWEGRDYDDKVKCLYRKAVGYLKNIFRRYGLEDVFQNSRGKCYVNRREVSCDYFEILDGKSIEETTFDGRYMMNYSWSEKTCGKLCRMAAPYLAD
ncbi:MAG: response regulator [Blautia sp.]|nr:response regulator [Lachnoclostridium sp.]MCM1210225.1 response regulator [Blautia sp.]